MIFFYDWLPGGHGLLPRLVVSPRQDISEREDEPIAVHRDVPGITVHTSGLDCPCSPIWRTRGEVESSKFKYEVSTLIGGCH